MLRGEYMIILVAWAAFITLFLLVWPHIARVN